MDTERPTSLRALTLTTSCPGPLRERAGHHAEYESQRPASGLHVRPDCFPIRSQHLIREGGVKRFEGLTIAMMDPSPWACASASATGSHSRGRLEREP